MRIYDIIAKKRDGFELTDGEIAFFVRGYTNGEIKDSQAAALLMAVYLNGMTDRETVCLTNEMARSGDMLDLSAVGAVTADKHSTGGVGDKTTLVVAPVVASLGVKVAKMSGRSLGHTGGTVDKLESIEGFRTELSGEEFIEQVKRIGVCVVGQSGDLAPADKKLYALRDETATVGSIPLIASSIMSKKLAAGAECIVLDVKTGSGAFMKKEEDAFALAKEMTTLGNNAGRKTYAVISDMDQPLGFAVGNALEVREAIETLQGNGPDDFVELCMTLGSYMLIAGGKASDVEEAKGYLKKVIEDGSALQKLGQFVRAQGGDDRAVFEPELLPKASIVEDILSDREGYISHIECDEIGVCSLILGGGRETKESEIDLSVGLVLRGKVGDFVKKGESIAVIHGNDRDKIAQAKERFLKAYSFSKSPVEKKPFIKGVITP